MIEDKFDTMYEGRFDALKKKYEAEVAIAKTELDTYFQLMHRLTYIYTSKYLYQ